MIKPIRKRIVRVRNMRAQLPPITVTPASPWPTQAQAVAFYGNPADRGWAAANLIDVPCPWPLVMDTTKLTSIQIHKKCAASLTNVLAKVWNTCGQSVSVIQSLRYDRYSGSYNYRPMRGGSALSMHAFGCAIDWDDQDNQQHALRHLFTDASPLIAAFKAEGWIWGGDWSASSIDAMHVQAARVHS